MRRKQLTITWGLLNKSRPTAAQWIPAVFDGKTCANGPI